MGDWFWVHIWPADSKPPRKPEGGGIAGIIGAILFIIFLLWLVS